MPHPKKASPLAKNKEKNIKVMKKPGPDLFSVSVSVVKDILKRQKQGKNKEEKDIKSISSSHGRNKVNPLTNQPTDERRLKLLKNGETETETRIQT